MKLSVLGMTVVLLAGPAVAVADKLDDTFQSLKDAVAKKDAEQVKKLVTDLEPLVKEAMATPAPADADQKQTWTNHQTYVKSVAEYSDYALFATALASPPAEQVTFLQLLEKRNPSSKYLDQAYGQYLVALNQTGAAAKIPAIAEKALVNFPENEDLLLVLVDSAVNRKQADRALALANRLTAALTKHGKPENLATPDWERKRNAALGHGYYVAGSIYSEKGNYLNADKKLRAALPLIKGNDAMMGPALFHLGMANYQLGKMTANKAQIVDAAKFSEQSALIAGPFTEQARHNALVMKAEAAKMR